MSGPGAGRRLTGVGFDVCRLTVRAPERTVDLTLPSTAPVGEVLALVMPEDGTGPADPLGPASWILQRLGGRPLDPGATPDSLGLHDGDVLYVSPAEQALPEADYDDVALGVAEVVAQRPDQWRPDFSRALLLGGAGVLIAAYTGACILARPFGLAVVWCLVGATALLVWACAADRVFGDRTSGVLAGVGACVLGGLGGVAGRAAQMGTIALDRRALALTGAGVAIPALIAAIPGRLPLVAFGPPFGWGAAAALAAGVGAVVHGNAAGTAGVLAVAAFVAVAISTRVVLRAAGLRVPLLPRTAEELQLDIEPAPAARVSRHAAFAVSCLTAAFAVAAGVELVASLLLAASSSWAQWTLGLVLGAAVLLRSRSMMLGWQRLPTALAGVGALAGSLALRTLAAAPDVRIPLLSGLLVAGVLCLSAARWGPGRRMLPFWGHLADLLETGTAVALVPLLLQVLHVYASIRALIH